MDKITSGLEEMGINTSTLKIDHIAYQVGSDAEYDRIKPEFLKLAQELREPLVNNRRITVLKLNSPLEYKEQTFEGVELIAPLQGQIIELGLEHAEFMTNEPLEDFIARYPNIKFDTANMNRETFPMIKLRLNNGLMVKFPKYPLISDK